MQSHPLDLNDPDFFHRRAEKMREKLKWLKRAKKVEIERELEETWMEHFDKISLVHWDKFEGLEPIKVNPLLYASCIASPNRLQMTNCLE